MTRVSTYGNYQSALMNLMTAQNRAADAQERVSTEKIATSLTGFGRGSETLTAMKSMQARIQGFMDTGEVVAARLSAQDTALNRVADGALGAREAIADALAAGRLEGLMLELESQFQMAQDGLNTKHQGRYLFSGGNTNTPPVTVMTMSELADTTASAVFTNDRLKQVSRLDEGTTMETAFLADDTGAALFEIFRDIQLFHETTPITGQGDETIRNFLSQQLSRLDAARTDVVDMAARNGSMQNRAEAVLKSQEEQKISLDEMLGKKTDADMAQALTDLDMADLAIQASAQVLSQLRDSSLLNYLR